MSLELNVNDLIKKAMLARDEKGLRGLRAIKAALIIAKTAEGANGQVAETEEIKLLQKLVKQRKDSLAIYQEQNRADLAQKEQEEIEVIEAFLPKQLNEEALKGILIAIISETGAVGAADMGKVMAAATKQLSGKADGKTISAMVKNLLSK